MTNQWPDFSSMPKPKTVRSVILEEGAGISEKTNGAVVFDVETAQNAKGDFVHNCSLVVPKIAYRYPFLRIEQHGLEYPVTIFADYWQKGKLTGNEEELRKNLGLVFRSEETKKTVLLFLDLLS